MRKIAWGLMLAFAFAIPWEYSLDLGEPFGNIARVVGLFMLVASIPATLQSGRMRTFGPMQWLVLALFLWFGCSYLWSIDPAATLEKLRGYFQEMMIVWLVWQFAETPQDLRFLLRAFVAGSWVLALLTLANFTSAEAIAAEQIRFVADGQDPNDVARFLDLAFPLAALLANCERGWPARLLALGYLPVGLAAVVLTASRGGFVAALVSLAGCALLLVAGHPKAVLTAALALPLFAGAMWLTVPYQTWSRLATIPAQVEGGDLNQRLNIWDAGWHAFVRSPLVGSGAGTFVAASAMNPRDTAHNTTLSILVAGGLMAFLLAAGVVTAAAWSTLQTRGSLRTALATILLVWVITSMVDTVEENRTTWLLLGIMATAGRLARDEPVQLEECFAARPAHHPLVDTSFSTRPAG
jgi:O-antigen ligase